jgi:hypothetical protein
MRQCGIPCVSKLSAFRDATQARPPRVPPKALIAVAAGAMKVSTYEKYNAMPENNSPTDINRGLVMFIGVAGLASAIGAVLPMAANVAPWLSPLAAG